MQNRNTRIGVLFALLFLISFAADAMGYAHNLDSTAGFIDAAQPNVAGLTSIVTTFVNLITFQITGIPLILSLVVLVITIWLVLDIISVLKGLLPFTSGE